MIPTEMNVADEPQSTFKIVRQPSLTWKIDFTKKRIVGLCDELKAYEQAVYLALNVERYKYLILSWNYGSEINGLIGQPLPFIVPELERVITEAIMQDDRTQRVHSFEFDTSQRGTISVTFVAQSIYGEVTIQKDLEI